MDESIMQSELEVQIYHLREEVRDLRGAVEARVADCMSALNERNELRELLQEAITFLDNAGFTLTAKDYEDHLISIRTRNAR